MTGLAAKLNTGSGIKCLSKRFRWHLTKRAVQPPGSGLVLLVDQTSCKHVRGSGAAAVWVAGSDAREGKDASLSTHPANSAPTVGSSFLAVSLSEKTCPCLARNTPEIILFNKSRVDRPRE